MLYYIYYGYVAGVTVYKLYEFWVIFKVTYTTASYTYTVINRAYKWIKETPDIDIDTWDMC
jgi:hypothetical protein